MISQTRAEQARQLRSIVVSDAQVAEAMGVSESTVRRYLRIAQQRDIKFTADEAIDQMLDNMVGFKKSSVPIHYRRIIANLVKHTELALSRVPKVEIKHDAKGKESANLLISDLHTGKQVYDDSGNCLYNKDILAFKLSVLRERVVKLLTKHLRINTLDEFNILLLGDIVDGSGIYPNQELNQDLTWIIDQIALAVAGIWDLVLAILAVGLTVNIYAVPGNHGRQGKETPLQNNFDYIVYQQLYMLAMGNEKVNVNYSMGTPYLNVGVKGWKVHLRHIAPAQTETPAARAKIGGWRGIHGWDILCYAHLHHPGTGTYLESDTIMNGSPIGIDDFSESLAKFSRPSQTLFGIDPEIGKSFYYTVYLDDFGSGDEAKALLLKYPMLCRVM